MTSIKIHKLLYRYHRRFDKVINKEVDMDFNTACPSGNLMVHAQDNSPDVTPSGECCECYETNGDHKCIWCLDKISGEQCIKGEGCCEECRKEHYESGI